MNNTVRRVAAGRRRTTSLRSARAWGWKVGLTVADQGAMSGANFLCSVLLARWLPPVEFGVFATAFATFLFLAGFHNALLVEPMSVLGPAYQGPAVAHYVSSLVWLHLALAGILVFGAGAAGILVGSGGLRDTLWALSLTLPLTLLFWLLRRAAYLEVRASLAASSSVIYAVVLLGSILLLRSADLLSGAAGLLAMALAGLAASTLTWVRLGIRLGKSPAHVAKRVGPVAAAHWHQGRWMAATEVFNLGSMYIQTYLAAAWLGFDAAGVLRAMQSFTLPMYQVTTALGVLALPLLAREFLRGGLTTLQRKGLVVTAGLVGSAAVYSVGLYLSAGQLERAVYGGKYGDYVWLVSILAVTPVLGAVSQGYSLILRAMRRPRYYPTVAVSMAVAGVLSAVPLISVWGLGGAAVSVVVTGATAALTNYWLFRAWTRIPAAGPDRINRTS